MRRERGVDLSRGCKAPTGNDCMVVAVPVMRPSMDGENRSPPTAQSNVAAATPTPPARVSSSSMLSSDPHAWLRPYYAALRSHPAFLQFAPATQFEALVKAVEREHASNAAQMREWTASAQHALLLHLASMLEQHESAAPFELWHVRKRDRRLHCVAVYLPTGIDLRLLEGDGFRRTQLCRDAPEVHALADKWHAALLEAGWTA